MAGLQLQFHFLSDISHAWVAHAQNFKNMHRYTESLSIYAVWTISTD